MIAYKSFSRVTAGKHRITVYIPKQNAMLLSITTQPKLASPFHLLQLADPGRSKHLRILIRHEQRDRPALLTQKGNEEPGSVAWYLCTKPDQRQRRFPAFSRRR